MKKKIILSVVLVAAALTLTGCNLTPLEQSLTNEQRLAFEKACNEAKGSASGLIVGTPTCTVTFTYPRLPGEELEGDR